jgi:hypothetical protein
MNEVTKYESHYPLVCLQGPTTGQWYIIANGQWHGVNRKYKWEELEKMWIKVEYVKNEVTIKAKKETQTWKVEGSRGNTYKVVNEGGSWRCSCPSGTYHRGDCKHVKQIKTNKHEHVHN